MKYFHTSAIALLLMLLSATPLASAYDIEYDGLYYNLISENDTFFVELTYKAGTPYEGDIIVPSTIKYGSRTLTVKYIGVEAFTECAKLNSVTLPNTIIEISQTATASTVNRPLNTTTCKA